VSSQSALEAITASQRLLDRGELGAARAVLDNYLGDRSVDLQYGAIVTESVLSDGGDPAEAVAILTAHVDTGRGLDLIGTAHYHAAITTGAHTLPEAIGECTAASRLSFDHPRWKAANLLHIGMIQQRQGSHDIATIYLEDAYRRSQDWAAERAPAAHHLGLDAAARGDEATAVRYLEEGLELGRLNALRASIPGSLLALAEALESSTSDRVGKLIDEAVEIARSLRVRRPLARALLASGRHHVRPLELAEARALAADLGDTALLSLLADPN
jgi:hypothetical protein